LANVFSTAASAMFIKQPTALPRMKEIHRKICLLPVLFNDNFMSKVMARCILGAVYKHCTNSTLQSLQDSGVELISVLFFSRQPDENWKEKFDTNIGRTFSRFRNGLLMSAFMGMQNNKFGTFSTQKFAFAPPPDKSGTDNSVNSTGNDVVGPLHQPFWLRSGYVRTEHCLSAAAKFEKKGSSDGTDLSQSQSVPDTDSMEPSEQSGVGKSKSKITGPITCDEIAIEASCSVYKIITSLLHRSRASSRSCLFQHVLYLLQVGNSSTLRFRRVLFTLNGNKFLSRPFHS